MPRLVSQKVRPAFGKKSRKKRKKIIFLNKNQPDYYKLKVAD